MFCFAVSYQSPTSSLLCLPTIATQGKGFTAALICVTNSIKTSVPSPQALLVYLELIQVNTETQPKHTETKMKEKHSLKKLNNKTGNKWNEIQNKFWKYCLSNCKQLQATVNFKEHASARMLNYREVYTAECRSQRESCVLFMRFCSLFILYFYIAKIQYLLTWGN